MYSKNNLLFLILINYILSLTNYNLELENIITFDNDSNNFGISDVWGYTDETGIEYAIVGYQYGTMIYNVSSSENPIEIANIIGPSNGDYYYHRDYKTYQNHLYIVNEMYGGDMGMQVIDLNPLPEGSPIQLPTYNNIAQSHNLWIDNSGYAFIEHQSGDNIQIANLNNPSYPMYEGSFFNEGLNCHDIFTRNGLGYISEGFSNRFAIYSLSDLDNISSPIATISCEGYAHNAWLNDNGTHLITTEETQNKTVKIWDISDLNNINLSGEYIGENGLAHNVHVLNDLLYISHYTTGIKIVDIFNPQRPIEVAAYDTYPENNNEGFYGCWGAYPFTNNNFVYASDMQNGLHIFTFNNIKAGFAEGYLYFNNSIPLSNASIKSTLNNKEYDTNANGYFNFGFPEGNHEFIINNEDLITINFIPHASTFYNFYIGETLISGDINSDGIINVLDVILTVNFILEETSPTNEEFWTADLNQDFNINIQDIILMINIIIN